MENPGNFETLVGIIARLRAPDGCPWDREQTHTSLRENLLSEAYEALEALDESNARKLGEELGDLLMQIVLHAQIASETGEFDINDVIAGISSKLVRRHPHVFGSAAVRDSGEVIRNWEKLKEAEREEGATLLGSLPRQMPALAYATEVQRRVAQVGFDWENIDGVIDKITEEARELKEAHNQEERAREFGDLLFTLVNFGRRIGIDSEAELRRANRRFYERFAHMEEACRQRGCKIGELSFDEQNKLWEAAKRAVNKSNK